MLIIDRYLLRQFIKTFVICYVSLTGLYIVFDAFTHLDEFLNYTERSEGLLSLMGSFYAYQSILFFELTSGLLTLVAAMFTLAWIQRHNELTALMAAGISRIRVVVPVICVAVVIALLAAANRELVIPRIRNELSRQPSDLMRDHGQQLQPRYDNRTDVLIRGEAVYGDRQRIEEPDFLLPPGELSRYGPKLAAENAFYMPPEGGRAGGYLMANVKQPAGLDGRASLRLGNRLVLITPRDADWLEPGQCFLVSDVSFEKLTEGQAFRKFSSTAQLISGLEPELDFGADVRVAIHSRMVQPFLDLTLLFLGLPLVVSRESRNVFLAIGMCIGVVALFLLVVIGFQYLGSIYLVNPALAAWAPLMVFVPPAVWLSESMWR